MEPTKKYIVYKRNGTVSGIVYWGLWTVLMIWFADLTDTYPDINEFLGLLLVIGIFWGPFFIGQVVSRLRCVATVKADAILHTDADSVYRLIHNDYPVLMLRDVRAITVKHGLFSGNYLSIELRVGRAINLYAKQYMFTQNPGIFELYVELQTAWTDLENIEKQKIRTAQEWEGFVGAKPMHENTVASLSTVAESGPIPSTVKSTAIPQSSSRVRSAVRNSNEHYREPERAPQKREAGNGIVVAAVIFCLFLLWIAFTISSYEVPSGLDGVRDMLYKTLIVMALILGGIVVVSFVMKRSERER